LKDKNTRPEGKDWNWCDKHHAWGRHEAAKCTLEYGGKPQNKNLEVVKSAEQQEIDDSEAFFEPANFAEWSSQALDSTTSDSTPSLRTTVATQSTMVLTENEIPVEVNGMKTTALADTGANKNFIAQHFAEELGLHSSKEVKLMASNTSVPLLGICSGIKLKLAPAHRGGAEREKAVELLVMEMLPGKQQLLLGTESLRALGIGLIGLPSCFPAAELEVDEPILNMEKELSMEKVETEIFDCMRVLNLEQDNKSYSSYLFFFVNI
jgi:hypothetical protein